jgi:hypothetical protein
MKDPSSNMRDQEVAKAAKDPTDSRAGMRQRLADLIAELLARRWLQAESYRLDSREVTSEA